MPISIRHNGFSGGIVLGELRSREDTQRYLSGCQDILNFIIRKTGSAVRRPGSRHDTEVFDSSKRFRLVNFQLGDGYVLEVGDLYLRVWPFDEAAGKIDASGGPEAHINTPWTVAEIGEITWEQSKDTLYLYHPSHQTRTLVRNSDGTWTLDYFERKDGPYLESRQQEVALSLSDNAAGGRRMFADKAFFTDTSTDRYKVFSLHGGYARIDSVVNGLEAAVTVFAQNPSSKDATFEWFGPFVEGGALSDTITSDAAGAAGTVAILTAAGSIFSQDDEGRIIQLWGGTVGGTQRALYLFIQDFIDAQNVEAIVIQGSVANSGTGNYASYDIMDSESQTGKTTMQSSGKTGNVTITFSDAYLTDDHEPSATERGARFAFHNGLVEIVSVTDPQNATASVIEALSSTAPTPVWQESFSRATGFQRHGAFHQRRLCDAGPSVSKPETIYTSKTVSDVSTESDFKRSADDDGAMVLPLSAARGSAILWLVSLIDLIALTESAEHAVAGVPLTPSNLGATVQSNRGSAIIRPQVMGNSLLFVGRSGKKVFELFSDVSQLDAKQSQDRSFVVADLLKTASIVEAASADNPDPIVFFVLDSGEILSLTFDKQEGVLAWHRQKIAGTDAGDAIVETICVLQTSDKDVVIVGVKRIIDGSTYRSIETLDDSLFMDSAIEATLGPGTAVTGLSHLEGEDVDVLADGLYVGRKTVSGGQIILDEPATAVQVGLPISGNLIPTQVEAVDAVGSWHNRIKHISGCVVEVRDTQTLSINGKRLKLRKPGDDPGQPPPARSEPLQRLGLSLVGRDPQLILSYDEPYPCEIQGLTRFAESGDAA